MQREARLAKRGDTIVLPSMLFAGESVLAILPSPASLDILGPVVRDIGTHIPQLATYEVVSNPYEGAPEHAILHLQDTSAVHIPLIRQPVEALVVAPF